MDEVAQARIRLLVAFEKSVVVDREAVILRIRVGELPVSDVLRLALLRIR